MRNTEAADLVNDLDVQIAGVKFKVYRKAKGVNGFSVKPIKMVARTNLMSGKTFFEDEDTPIYCSPSSETYWSM